MTGRVDVHQHLWPEPLLAALSRRSPPPAHPPLRRRVGAAHRRRARVARGSRPTTTPCAGRCWSSGTASTARSSRCRARWASRPCRPARPSELLAAYHAGASALGDRLPAWASAGLARPDPRRPGRSPGRGFRRPLPAGRRPVRPRGRGSLRALLSTLEERGSPLLVHPGPAPWSAPPSTGQGSPDWWPALTSYVAQIHAAWMAFRAWVRPAHPRLRACFAMLAGLAPLHSERLGSRRRGAGARTTPASSSTRRRTARARSPRWPAVAGWDAPGLRLRPPRDRPRPPTARRPRHSSSTTRAPPGSSPPRRCSRDRSARSPLPPAAGPLAPGRPARPGRGAGREPRALGLARAPRPEARVFELLWTDHRVDVWLICWSGEDHDTGFHDHDVSSRRVRRRARGDWSRSASPSGAPVRRRLAGASRCRFPPSHVHRVQGVGTVPAVSIHAYSPPLARMGVYGVADDGDPPARGRRRHPRAPGRRPPGLTCAAPPMSLVLDRDHKPT